MSLDKLSKAFFFLNFGINEIPLNNSDRKKYLKNMLNTQYQENLSIPHNGRDLPRIARGRACPTFSHHDNAVRENIPSSISDASLIYFYSLFFCVSHSNISPPSHLVPTNKYHKHRLIGNLTILEHRAQMSDNFMVIIN